MKPRRAPCFFSKASRERSRAAIPSVMSISLKVVSIAAVFCAAFSPSAMRRRRRGVAAEGGQGRGELGLPGDGGGGWWGGGRGARGDHVRPADPASGAGRDKP